MATVQWGDYEFDVEDWQAPILESMFEDHGTEFERALDDYAAEFAMGGSADFDMNISGIDMRVETVVEEIIEANDEVFEEYVKARIQQEILERTSPLLARFMDFFNIGPYNNEGGGRRGASIIEDEDDFEDYGADA